MLTRRWAVAVLWAGVMLMLAPVGARHTWAAAPRHEAPSAQVPPRQAPSKPAPATNAPQKPQAAKAVSRGERPVPFTVGETLEFDVSWSTFLTAGTATLKVLEKKPSFGSTAYYIYAEGRPTPLVSKLYSLYYKADTLLDVFTLLPQRASTYSEESGRRRMKITRFNQTARTAEYEVQTATVVKTTFAVPPFTQDILSAVYVLRALPLKQGARMTMPVADGGAPFSVRVTVGVREPVRTGVGTIPAWKVTPVITDREGHQVGSGLVLWISDDARRLPLKLEAALAVGRFVLTLRTAR